MRVPGGVSTSTPPIPARTRVCSATWRSPTAPLLGGHRMAAAGPVGDHRLAQRPGQHAVRSALPLRLHLQLGEYPFHREGSARYHGIGRCQHRGAGTPCERTRNEEVGCLHPATCTGGYSESLTGDEHETQLLVDDGFGRGHRSVCGIGWGFRDRTVSDSIVGRDRTGQA